MAHTLSHPRLLALAALIALAALVAAALLTLAPARADSHNNQLILELLDDSDNIVPPGSEITIRATLRFSGDLSADRIYQISNSALTLSGSFDWDESAGSRLPVNFFDTSRPNPLDAAVDDMGNRARVSYNPITAQRDHRGRTTLEILSPSRADGTSVGNTGRIVASGLHARTLLATSNFGEAYLFDAFARRQVAVIPAPALPGVDPLSFGRPDADVRFNVIAAGGGAVAWQESEKTAWLFITSTNDDIEGVADVGSLYIYKVDWSKTPVEVEMVKRLAPPLSEFGNVSSANPPQTEYGSSIKISGDGSTLAVGARRMNHMGAVYVYTRPEGGASWADLEYADGVKLTVHPVPAWGDPNDQPNTRPFDRPDAPLPVNCNLYCRQVHYTFYGGDFQFAYPSLGLSYDGAVLAVSAHENCYEEALPSTGFDSNGNAHFRCTGGHPHLSRQGIAFVFTAPAGGWQSAPEAAYDDDGNAKALVRAGEDATGFDPDTHYSPGPARRITAASARLVKRGTQRENGRFGRTLAVSGDGLTVAVSWPGSADGAGEGTGPRGNLYVYQMNDVSGWTGWLKNQALELRADTQVGYHGLGGFALNYDGSVMLVGSPRMRDASPWPAPENYAGRVQVWLRAAARWSDVSPRTHSNWNSRNSPFYLRQPTTNTNRGYFGMRPLFDLDYARYVISRPIFEAAGPITHNDGNSASNLNALSGFILSDGHNCLPTVFEDGEAGVTCQLATNKVEIPPGTEVQKLTVAGTLRLGVQGSDDEPVVIRAEPLIITVDEVQELAELKLERATNDRGTPADPDDDVLYPAAIARGESTTLRLQVLNEHGKASARNSISVVNVTTSAGTLSSALGCRGGGAALTCIIEGSALNAGNADKVLITLRHAGTAATANVRASAVSIAGDTADVGPLAINLTGPPASLAIAEPPGGLLGVDTTDTGEDADNRDVVTLAVTAADALGGKVAVPASGVSAWLSDPVGARVASGVEITWPLLGADGEPELDPDRNRQVRVNVNRAAGQALRSGEYTLTVRAGGLTATRKLAISGDAATVALSEPTPAPALNGQFTVTAVVADASGAAVPNGTSVRWAAESLLESTSLVQLTAERITSGGEASATYLVVAPGRTSVRATVGGVSNVQLVEIADTTAPTAPLTVAEQLTHRALSRPVSWLGEGTVTASALLAAVEGATTVQLWQYGRWIRYGVSEGREIPGSFNFIAENGAVLWFSE